MQKIQRHLKFLVAVMVCTLMLWNPIANACTGIMLHNKDGTTVHGRTGEFGYFLDTDVAVVPRNYEFTGETPEGDGLKFKTKYASVGVIAFDVLGYLDGMNEEGLGFGAFWFPTFAEYATLTPENIKKAVSPSQFGNWILGQFSNIDEVKAAIENGDIVISPTPAEGFGEDPPPFHYVVYDKSCNGLPADNTTETCINSIVIEPLNGELVVHDNPLGVMTNSPTFDWHMTNLRNYITLDPRNVPSITVNNQVFEQLGQGNGMLGLPGDITPPSRFTRAAVFSATAVPSENADDGIKQVFHILNNFDIPVGVAREVNEETGQLLTNYTIITGARDPQNLRYYYKTYEDQTLRMVDLNKFDMDAQVVKQLKTDTDQPIVDMSDKLKER